jgi:hypothetical protein
MTTAPASAGPMGILGVFVFMYVSALGVLTFLLYGVSTTMTKLIGAITDKAQPIAFTLRKSYYYASVVALAPVMLVAMQSVNEVGFYQLLLVVIFVVIAWVYITKRMA